MRWVLCVSLSLVTVACTESSSIQSFGSTGGGQTSDGGGGSGGTGGQGGSSTNAGGDLGLGGNFGSGGFVPTPVIELPGLVSITFWERTGGDAPTDYTFDVDGSELTAKLADPLSDASHDIPGATSEYYDVYYSDGDGIYDLNGSYLTISGVFGIALPAGGGLNLAEIGLNLADDTEYGNYVASFVVLGDNGDDTTVPNCIDGDLQTHTTMGNTVGSSERLRLTLGFESTSGPPTPD